MDWQRFSNPVGTRRGPSVAYEAARERFNSVSRWYEQKRREYRAREIDDDEFLAARRKFEEASLDFDEAERRLDASELLK